MRPPDAFVVDGDATPASLARAAAHRCEEEYKVLVENGARALARSPLAALLPGKPLRWVVVEARGGAMVETWSERSTRSR